MSRHQRYQTMLLFPDNLGEAEQITLNDHLRGCAECRKGAEMIASNRTLLSSLGREKAPQRVRDGVMGRLPATAPRRTWRLTPVQWRTATGLLAALVVVLSIAVATSRRGTPRADAYGILQRVAQGSSSLYPYTGSSVITFRQIPWSLLPPDVAKYEGQHRVVAHWSVRDATHFRVDIQVLDPVLERGAITVVVNGAALTTYDSRTGKARVLRGTAWQRRSISPRTLLGYLQSGATVSLQQPDPAQSITGYLAQLRKFRSQPGIHPYIHIVNRMNLLGHAVDVVQFAPLQVTSYDSGGCYPTSFHAPHHPTVTHPPTGPCHHYRQAVGWARVWVDQDRPFILRYQEYGLHHVYNVLHAPIRVQYRVTSISYGRGPSTAQLQYRPPTPVVEVHAQELAYGSGGTLQSGDDVTPSGWVPSQVPDTVGPTVYSRLATSFHGQVSGNSSFREIFRYSTFILPYIPGFDVLYSHPTHWVQVFTNWHGQIDIYVTGPYVLVQERKLAPGLPAPYQTGPPSTAGRCRVWTGRYADGQRWLSFRRGAISVVISTNSLSTHQLVRYASDSVCT